MISNFKVGDIFIEKFNVSKELQNKFIELSNDKNPLHVNDEFAKKVGFKSKVVQGNLQNCFISYFIGECLPHKNVMILSQIINFKNPLYLGDTIFLNAKIISIHSSVGFIEFDYKFKNQLDEVISNGKITLKLL